MKETSPAHFSIPREIRLISIATAIRWIGWGMAEPLIPVFLFLLLKSYGASAVVSSVGEIVFFLILPVAGILADRIPLKTFLVVGLVIFFFDGLWSLAAITGVALLAFLASMFDGVAVASDVVGRATYIRRYAPGERVASVMGFQNTLINFGMVIGGLASIGLVRFAGFSWIFFGIIPTNAIALILFIRYLRKDDAPRAIEKADGFAGHYWSVWKDALRWRNGLHVLADLTIFFYALSSLATILIPIYAYIHGANLEEIIVLSMIAVLPQLAASRLGKIADASREKLLPSGLVAIAVLLAALAFTKTYTLLLPLVLLLEIVLTLLGLAVEKLVTVKSDPAHYGRVSAIFEGLKDVGKFLGAIGLGFALDAFGSQAIFLAVALVAILFMLWVRYLPRFFPYARIMK